MTVVSFVSSHQRQKNESIPLNSGTALKVEKSFVELTFECFAGNAFLWVCNFPNNFLGCLLVRTMSFSANYKETGGLVQLVYFN